MTIKESFIRFFINSIFTIVISFYLINWQITNLANHFINFIILFTIQVNFIHSNYYSIINCAF